MPSLEERLFIARNRYFHASELLAHVRRRAGYYKTVSDTYWRYQVWRSEEDVMRALDHLWVAQWALNEAEHEHLETGHV